MRDQRVAKSAMRFDKVVNADPMRINKLGKGKEVDP